MCVCFSLLEATGKERTKDQLLADPKCLRSVAGGSAVCVLLCSGSAPAPGEGLQPKGHTCPAPGETKAPGPVVGRIPMDVCLYLRSTDRPLSQSAGEGNVMGPFVFA